MAKKKKSSKKEQLSFEQALASLESIVRELESSELGLNEAIKQYEDGVRYLRICHATLADAEAKIEMLTRIDADGNAESQPFQVDDDDDLEAKQDQRAKRRSAQPPELF